MSSSISWEPDWDDVVRRANGPRRRVRAFVIGVALLAAILIPLGALAAANDWWFLRSADAPRPVGEPVVIKAGEWDGHAWQLAGYRSTKGDLCLSLTPSGSDSGAAMGCAPDVPITFLSGAASESLPAYIAGPVVASAVRVEITLATGEVLRVPTFRGPVPLDHVRFYLTRAPDGSAPRVLAGYDRDGTLVACLSPQAASWWSTRPCSKA